MKNISATAARESLYRLLEEVQAEPVQIQGRRSAAILVSEEDWRAIQETFYLLSVPGMRESIRAGLAEPIEECADEPGW
jgi:PHD/YefM family antitoxin component YafN of YafNO toxin-antitoxin module